jgi:hypothetical protein
MGLGFLLVGCLLQVWVLVLAWVEELGVEWVVV